MKKISVCLFSLLVIAGCSSTAVKDPAKITAKAAESSPSAADSSVANQSNSVNPKNSIYFSFDKSDVLSSNRPVLEENAKYFKYHSDAKIVLQGNTDERGSSEYNLALGNRRAENTKKMLAALGVSSNKIEVVSFGKEKPKSLCHEESCWTENRRADIVYSNIH